MPAFRVKNRERYRRVDGKLSVDLKLRTPRQLFDERDPAPFKERDLDDDAARYILQSFRELKGRGEVKLSLYFETLEELKGRPGFIGEAIHAFFNFERDVKGRELKATFRIGFISLLIGLSFLVACTLIYHGLIKLPGFFPDLFSLVFKEAAMIMGYVSMWKPLSIFLYEWWPIREELVELGELGKIEVDVFSSSGELLWSSNPLEPAGMRLEPTERKSS